RAALPRAARRGYLADPAAYAAAGPAAARWQLDAGQQAHPRAAGADRRGGQPGRAGAGPDRRHHRAAEVVMDPRDDSPGQPLAEPDAQPQPDAHAEPDAHAQPGAPAAGPPRRSFLRSALGAGMTGAVGGVLAGAAGGYAYRSA